MESNIFTAATATSVFGIFIILFIFGIFISVCIAQGFICIKVKNPLAGLVIPFLSFILGSFIPLIVATLTGMTKMFFILQIPTIIYLIIFAVVRISVRGKNTPKASKKEIEKMNIQDL